MVTVIYNFWFDVWKFWETSVLDVCVSFKWLTFKFKLSRLRPLPHCLTHGTLRSISLRQINTWDVYLINFGYFVNVHNFNKDNIVWQLQDMYCIFAAPARERYHQQERIKLVFPARSCNILYNLRIPIAILINFHILYHYFLDNKVYRI